VTAFFLAKSKQTEKWLWLHNLETQNFRKCAFKGNDAGNILFYHKRATCRVPLVTCNIYRIVICKRILLIFSLFLKDMFKYLSLVK
jgi:hypothetical protein